MLGKIRRQQQPRTVAEPPFDHDRFGRQYPVAAGVRRHAGEPRHDFARAKIDQRPIAGEPPRVDSLFRLGPVEPRHRKSRFAPSGRGCVRAPPRPRIRGNERIRGAAPPAPTAASPGSKSQKKANGRRLAHSSPMNNSGICGDNSTIAAPACKAGSDHPRRKARAKRVVADLIVVLQKGDERRRRQSGRGLAARPCRRETPMSRPDRQTFGQCPAETGSRVGCVITVIASGLAGHQHMQSMMQVVVPLCIVTRGRPLRRVRRRASLRSFSRTR